MQNERRDIHELARNSLRRMLIANFEEPLRWLPLTPPTKIIFVGTYTEEPMDKRINKDLSAPRVSGLSKVVRFLKPLLKTL